MKIVMVTSENDSRKQNRNAVTSPCAHSGTVIRASMRSRGAPSAIAAHSISSGTAASAVCNVRIAYGVTITTCASTRPISRLYSPIQLTNCSIAMPNTTAGTSNGEVKNASSAVLPGNG